MRIVKILLLLVGSTFPALASDGVHYVRPAKPGVPIIINGIDASYSVVEGDWGLSRGIHVQPTIYGGRYIDPVPRVGRYFPSAGHAPGYGRLEVEPPANRKLPKAAESFHQSWSAQSAPPAPQPEIPFDPPAVILGPGSYGDGSPQGRLAEPYGRQDIR